MNNACPVCGEMLVRETGFYWGAMYVSYGLMAGWFILTWIVDELFLKLDAVAYLLPVCISVILFLPVTFRISRLIWLNMWVTFDPQKYQQFKR
jgi:hypothetical protein